MNSVEVWVEGGKKEILNDQHYKASGGEGVVYQKGGTAYKIMHPGHAVIPEKKLQELGGIKADNVLIPLSYLLDSKGKRIGFTMRFVHDTEFLCKFFNNGFLQRNSISSQDMVDLVKEMQVTLSKVHDASCLVVDFNQMNFLVDGKGFKTPYFIDTDSYQTPSFPATALMDCVKDRKVKSNKFSVLSDWYSWGIVAFWTYIGTHPYRGSHPSYSNNDWCGKRMEDGISIFNKDVSMPGNCRDLSVIPKPHREWFQRVFEKGERSIPPFPDGISIIPVDVRLKDFGLFSTDTFAQFDSPIVGAIFSHGNRYVLTNKSLYKNDSPVFSLIGKKRVEFVETDEDPVLAFLDGKNLSIFSWKDKEILHQMEADCISIMNHKLYSKSGNMLVEHSCTKIFDKRIHSVRVVSEVFGSATKLFDGIVVQDVFGQCLISVCDKDGNLANVEIKELNKKTIIDAKCIGNVAVVIAEKSGKFYRSVITFSDHCSDYHYRSDEVDAGESAEFIVKSNGLCIGAVSDDLESWSGNKIKTFKGSPIPSGSIMYCENDKTMFFSRNTIVLVEKKN